MVLPITDAVREVLNSLERGACPTVLATSDGEPWTPPGRGLDRDVATILGWELQRVKEIARRYLTGEGIGLGMIARLQ